MSTEPLESDLDDDLVVGSGADGHGPRDAPVEKAGVDEDGVDEAAVDEAANPDPSEDLSHPDDSRPDVRRILREPLSERPWVRGGAYAWAFIGIAIVTVALGIIVARLSTVVIPIVLALFPAAVLQPAADRLRGRGVPDAAAAFLVLTVALGTVGTLVWLLAPSVADQLESLGDSIADGYGQLERFLARGPFGLDPIRVDDIVGSISDRMRGGFGGFGPSALGVARAVFEGATALVLMLIVLFFYLKDGRAIARWVVSLFPQRLHADAKIIGEMLWRTIGGYIQGQLLVALIDAIGIGIGLWILGVPLALPLGVIVFFGGLFPVVGAFISGALAALVALATNGPETALIVIVITIAVQQIEGNLLQPFILGRAVALHPLAIILSLAVGGFILGILGAFLAVPVAAGGARAVGYLRQRIPG